VQTDPSFYKSDKPTIRTLMSLVDRFCNG